MLINPARSFFVKKKNSISFQWSKRVSTTFLSTWGHFIIVETFRKHFLFWIILFVPITFNKKIVAITFAFVLISTLSNCFGPFLSFRYQHRYNFFCCPSWPGRRGKNRFVFSFRLISWNSLCPSVWRRLIIYVDDGVSELQCTLWIYNVNH